MKKASLWKLGGLKPMLLARRVWKEIQGDKVFNRAAELSYYFLLALFPLLILLTSVFGLIIGEQTELRQNLFNYLSQVMPPSALQLTDTTLQEISTASGGGKISFGVLATLWAASNGMGAITEALNVAYDANESRPWWKTRLTAILLTIGLGVLIITALIIVLAGGKISGAIAGNFSFGSVFTWTWKILQWPLVFVFITLAFALIYYFAPDVEDQSWQWITPGSVIGVVLWLLVSFAFRIYLSFFDSYGKTYGSLGAVIILMLWLYLTGAAVLIGGEVNAEIEHAAAEAGAADAKQKGEKTSAAAAD